MEILTIIVNPDGVTGRDKNPHEHIWEGPRSAFAIGQYNNFESTVQSYPLTEPLTPGSEVKAGLIFQVFVETKGWLKYDPEYKWHVEAGLQNRYAYEPIKEDKTENPISPNLSQIRNVDETLSIEEVVEEKYPTKNLYSEIDRQAQSLRQSDFISGYNHALQSKGLVSRDKVVATVEKFYADNDIWQTRFKNLLDELNNIKKL